MSSPVRVLEHIEEHVEQTEPKSGLATRILGRMVRIVVAVALLMLSAWVLLPFGVVPVSMVAVTNARISRVRSSINGQVVRFAVEIGDRVKSGQKVCELVTVSPGAGASFEQLLKKKSEADVQHASLLLQEEDAEKNVGAYRKAVTEYAARMTAETEMRLNQATRESDAAKTYLQQLKESAKAPRSERVMELDREIAQMTTQLADLRAKYSESHPDVQRLRAALADAKRQRQEAAASTESTGQTGSPMEQIAAARELEAKNTAVERLRTELLNLKSGYFVGPDMPQPPTLGLRDQASALLARIREQKLINELELKSIADEMKKIPAAVTGESVILRSAVDGTVWSRDMASGQIVREGDDLIRIAESDSLDVEAYVDARYARQVSIGDRAVVNLSNGKRLMGRVVAIQGPGQRKAEADAYAIDLKAPVEGLYHVVVRFDASERGGAHIGQVAKVVFTGGDGSLPSRLYSWLNSLWGGSHT